MRNGFYFSQQEKRGILYLFFLLIFFKTLFFLENRYHVFEFARPIFSNIQYFEADKTCDVLQKSTATEDLRDTKTVVVESKDIASKVIKIDLNTSDSNLLFKKIPLPKKIISRIVRYKHRLGGFFSFLQLNEVYGLQDYHLKVLQKYTYIDIQKVEKINLNQADFKTLIKHPYLDILATKAILNYKRKQLFESITDLKTYKILSDSIYDKILPYLKLNE